MPWPSTTSPSRSQTWPWCGNVAATARPPVRPALVVEWRIEPHLRPRVQGQPLRRGGVRDYWIVNLVDLALEVYRDPGQDPAAPYGWRYRTVEWLGPPAAVSPLALPAVRIAVSELLP